MPVSFSIADSSDGPQKVVIWVRGELDAETGRAVRARLAQAERHGGSEVILDLTHITSIDASAVTSIVNGAQSMSQAGNLRVISPPDDMAKMLEDAGLASAFELTPNRRAGHDDRRRSGAGVDAERRKGDRREGPPAASLDRR